MTKPTKKPAKRKPAKKTAAVAVAQSGPAKAPGVIATILAAFGRKDGVTVDQLLAELTKRFKDRDPSGMRKTIIIQASRQRAKRGEDGKYSLPGKRS